MRTSHLLLGVAGAGLFCAGVVLARSSSPAAPAPVVAAPAVVATTRTVAPVLAPHRTSSTLAADLRDPDARVRAVAIADVARDPDADPKLLLAASRDRDVGVALRATAALGKLYAQGAIPASELATRATDHALDPKVRTMAMNGLGGVPSTDAAKLFAELAATGDPMERRASVTQLANQDAAAAVPLLIDALGDADEIVRGNAVEALRHQARGRDYGTDANAWRSWWQSRIVTP
jgi:HEAT repeat protein